MTVLDTWYLLFKTDIPKEASPEIARLDKQIDELSKKGKKRSEDENKQYEVLKKQRKQLLDDTKQQQRETDKLADSFGNIASNIIGAATAFATLGGLKSGILDAAKLNSTIYLQSKVTGQSADELRAYGAAIASFGGDAQSFVAAQKAMAQSAAESGITYKNVGAFLDSIHSQLQEADSLGEKQRILGLAHITDLPTQAFLEQNEEYAKSVELHKRLAAATHDDYLEAFKFEQASQDAGTAFSSAFTRLGTDILPVVTKELDKLNKHIKSVEQEKGGIEAFFTEAAAGAGLLIPPLRVISAAILAITVASRYAKSASEALFGTYNPGGGSFFGSNRGGRGRGASGTAPNAPSSSAKPYSSMDYLISQGYTPGQAAGILGNAQVESSGNPAPAQNAYNIGHFGKFQWDAKRRAEIRDAIGIDVATASDQEQDRAFVWDAARRGDDARIRSGTTPEGAAAITSSFFERPGQDGSILARMRSAHQLAAQYNAANGVSASSGSTSIKTGDITINTQATDSGGIARAFREEMEREFHTAFSAIDDGQDR